MSTTLMSALSALLLTAACLTALADPPKKPNRISTEAEPSVLQVSTTPAPATPASSAADDGFIRASGRTSSHSMHPNAPAAIEQFADDDVNAPQPAENQ